MNQENQKQNFDDEVEKLSRDYEELRIEIDGLLLQNSKKVKSRIIGAFTGAGATVEKIILYIIKKEGREKQLQILEGKQLGLFEYKKIIQDKIPKQQNIHIGTINQWRNLVAHANDIDKVDEHELGAVRSALKSFANWFFEDYLKGEYADGILKKLTIENSVSEEKSRERDKRVEIPPINNLGLNVRKAKSRKKIKIRSLFIILVFVGLIYCSYCFYFYKPTINNSAISVKKQMSKEEVYEFLIKYFNSLNEKGSDAHVFFASRISNFYLKKDINPTDVNIIRQINTEFLDIKHSVDKESLILYQKNDTITYWRFWNDFMCYRTSMRKFETCKILMEFGINTDNKITSIKEIDTSELKFSKKKPY